MITRPKTYENYVPPASGKAYQITASPDGTSKITDVTQYLQTGDPWGAGDANAVWNAIMAGVIFPATHSKSGTTNTLTGVPADAGVVGVAFVATADFTEGDTWQINGTAYTAATQTGEPLTDAIFTSGAAVLVLLNSTNNTLTFIGGGSFPSSGGTFTGPVVAGGTQDPATAQVRNIYAGTADLTAGQSALSTGAIYLVYE